jgi:hypothetical protein
MGTLFNAGKAAIERREMRALTGMGTYNLGPAPSRTQQYHFPP